LAAPYLTQSNVAAYRGFGHRFPAGTLTVNMLGSLVMGIVAGYFALKSDPGAA
jgi:CrcB protein